MPITAKIQGLDKLVASLRAQAAKSVKGDADVVVGYTAAYAIYVHENLEAHHPVGQAKFLEQPARTLRPQMMELVVKGVRKKLTLGQSMLAAGLLLQRESQQLVPVDTGNLKNSAFTRLEQK